MGAPGRVEGGDVELGGAAGGADTAPFFGGPAIAIGISDRWSVEAGGDFNNETWALGFVGGRATGRAPQRGTLELVGDAELGAGVGVGGRACSDDTTCTVGSHNWALRPAGGAYLGVGGALRWRIPSVWLRARTQLTDAKGIPPTSWNSGMAGIEFAIGRAFSLWAGYGLASYTNTVEHVWGRVYEIGAAVKLGRIRVWR